MTWTEFLFLSPIILMIVAVIVFLGNRRRTRRMGVLTQDGRWQIREVDGQKIAIESDDPNQADVIAETWRTGKPVYGTYDKDGNFVMKVLGGDHDD